MKFVPIPEAIAREARTTMRDRFGHDLCVTVEESAPCRVCLRIDKEPNEFLLMSYQPLPDTGPYAEIGPIFIHARECEPYSDLDSLPEDFRTRRLVLRAYSGAGAIVDAVVAEPGEAEMRAREFFERDEIAEIHVRHTSYTCFDFKIVRATTPAFEPGTAKRTESRSPSLAPPLQ
jgi:hypothetical protein